MSHVVLAILINQYWRNRKLGMQIEKSGALGQYPEFQWGLTRGTGWAFFTEYDLKNRSMLMVEIQLNCRDGLRSVH